MSLFFLGLSACDKPEHQNLLKGKFVYEGYRISTTYYDIDKDGVDDKFYDSVLIRAIVEYNEETATFYFENTDKYKELNFNKNYQKYYHYSANSPRWDGVTIWANYDSIYYYSKNNSTYHETTVVYNAKIVE